MWNNGSYQQNWPVHASNAQQQNVDWGALAQAWIQNRATTEDTTQPPIPAKSVPANNPVQPNMQAPNFPPASWQNQNWNNTYGNNWMNNHGAPGPGENYMPHQDSSWYAPPNADGQFTPAAPPAVVEERPPLPPLPSASDPEPPRPPPSSDHPPEKDFHEPNNVPPNDSMPQQTPDYVQSTWNEPWQPHTEHNSEQWNPPHQANFDAPQWNRGSAPPPWMQGMNNNNQFVSGQAVCMPQDSMNAAPSMASRKLLPAWIREGLEKMEQEKQKKMNNQQNVQEEQDKSKWMEQQSGNRKSRFDSASEGESDAELPQAPESHVSDDDNEEEEETKPSISAAETQEEMMMKVRRMLTQVLLEVTDAEIKDIAAQVYKKASKAPAKPLMQSSALSSIGQLGVVSGYSSDEEENSNDEQAEDDTSSVDEDFLQRKIEVFEKMQVARIAELENGQMVQEEPEPDVTQQADEAREKEVEANVNDLDVSDRDAPLNAKQLAVVRDKEPGTSAPTPDSSPGESSASQNGEGNDADVERSREKHHVVRSDEVSRKESKRESPKSKKSSKSKHERDRRRSREREKESRHKKHSRSRHDDSDYDDRKSSHSKHRSSSRKLSSSATKRSRSDSSKRKRSSPHRSSKKLSYSHDKHHSSKSKKRRRKHSDSHSRDSSSSSYTSNNDSVTNYSSESDRSYRSHKRKTKKSKSAR